MSHRRSTASSSLKHIRNEQKKQTGKHSQVLRGQQQIEAALYIAVAIAIEVT